MSRILRGESTTPPPKSLTTTTRARAVWTVVAGLGAGGTLIGGTDLALGWLGLEFADRVAFLEAVNRHFASLLTPTMGLGAVAVGLMGRGNRKAVRSMSWLFGLVAAAHLVLLAMYFSIPARVSEPAAGWETLLRGATYAAVYGWVAYYLWAQTRILAWPSRPG
jgi:hypothetical protein